MKSNEDGSAVMENGDQVKMLTGIAGESFHLRPNAVVTLPHRVVTNSEWGRLVDRGAAEPVAPVKRGKE